MPRKIAPRGSTSRSAVSNGKALFVLDDNIDGRSAPARRFRDILAGVVSDLGGADELSEVQRQLARRFATLSLSLELLEAAVVEGQSVDLDLFARVSGQLNRLGNTLGIKRAAKDAKVLDLSAYMAAKTGGSS